MSTTLTNLKTVRRVLRGVSGPQPLAGTAQRAAEAYAAMTAADWIESDDGPSIPPHHFDTKSSMHGDAYRQTWGYDKTRRTERSACGAVCYTVRLPADAISGEACSILSVSANVLGDRYLECGAIITAMLSDDEAPPPWAAILEDGVSSSAILVPATTDAGGNDIEPNKRAETSATALLQIGDTASKYLHVVLRVADYLAYRDAWHEGGAMLAPESISVAFSRDVTPDAHDDFPLYWQGVLEDDSEYIHAPDQSAVFAIGVPSMIWIRTAAASPSPWTASFQELRALLDGMRQPLPITVNSTGLVFCDAPLGTAVIPYDGLSGGYIGWSQASDEAGKIWAGYKLVTMTQSGKTFTGPEQHVAAAIFPVTSMSPITFSRIVAPAVAIGSAISLRLLAYRIDARPPIATAPDVYGATVANVDAGFNGYPVPSLLDCANLLFGNGTSLAFVNSTSKYKQPLTQSASPITTTTAPISLLGSWNLDKSISAGTEFVFNEPLEVDGYAGLMLLAVPISYAPQTASDNAYVEWPLSGWSLRQ